MVAALIAAFAPPASAHTVSEWGMVYFSDAECTYGRAELSHGQYNLGHAEARVAQWIAAGVIPCSFPVNQGTGRMAVKFNLRKWSLENEEWYTCRAIDYHYNPQSVHSFSIQNTYGPFELPCGQGWYAVASYSYTLNGSTWQGGGMWSGYHYLPAGLDPNSAIAAHAYQEPPQPSWVKDNGEVDMDLLPDSFGAVDSQGNVVLDEDGSPQRFDLQKTPPLPEEGSPLLEQNQAEVPQTEDEPIGISLEVDTYGFG